MTDKVREQILKVRETGKTNMFDIYTVQRIGLKMGFYDMVIFIEEHKSEYVNFILHGDEKSREEQNKTRFAKDYHGVGMGSRGRRNHQAAQRRDNTAETGRPQLPERIPDEMHSAGAGTVGTRIRDSGRPAVKELKKGFREGSLFWLGVIWCMDNKTAAEVPRLSNHLLR